LGDMPYREEERAHKAAEKENKRPAKSIPGETGQLYKRMKHVTVQGIDHKNSFVLHLSGIE